MSRSDAQRERSQYRKTQQMIENTHGGNAGRSILEMLVEQLDAATARYMNKQNAILPDRVERGEIRGLARAISMMQNPYYPTRQIKQVEKDSAARVRRSHAAEQPHASEGQERE